MEGVVRTLRVIDQLYHGELTTHISSDPLDPIYLLDPSVSTAICSVLSFQL